MPRVTEDLPGNANTLSHVVRHQASDPSVAWALRFEGVKTCLVLMEDTCPHGWTLSRTPLPPVLPAPLGPIDLLGETMREDFKAMLDQLAEWAHQHIARFGLEVRPKSVLIQGHPKLLRLLGDVLYNPATRMSLFQALNYCINGVLNLDPKTEAIQLEPTDDGIYELRMIFLPALRFRLSS